jgi:hypothetical protein
LSASTVSPFATYADSVYHRSFDLEGIAVDGYGYVVTITAGDGEAQKGKSRRYWPFGRKDVEKNMWSTSIPAFGQRRGPRNEKRAIEIVTTRSLEMRESFYEKRDKKMVYN